MKTTTKVGIGLAALVLVGASTFAYASTRPYWAGPSLNVANVSDKWEKDPCWEVLDITIPRQLMKGESTVLKVEPTYWEQIRAYHKPTDRPIPLDQKGLVEKGDIACTNAKSQVWLYVPDGRMVWGYCNTEEWRNCRGAGGKE